MLIFDKTILGYLSIIIVVLVTLPYVRLVWCGAIKPHLFTWVIWALTTGIAAAARMSEAAGPGAWGQWAAAGSCVCVAALAWQRGEKDITHGDWRAFLLALAAIPLWVLTDDALLAVLVVTAIDVVGYYPTFRKSWHRPHEEAMFNYIAANVTHILSVLATEHYSVTNLLFQVTLFVVNSLLVAMVLWRRRQLATTASPPCRIDRGGCASPSDKRV